MTSLRPRCLPESQSEYEQIKGCRDSFGVGAPFCGPDLVGADRARTRQSARFESFRLAEIQIDRMRFTSAPARNFADTVCEMWLLLSVSRDERNPVLGVCGIGQLR